MNNSKFLEILEIIRENDKTGGTSIEETAMKILQALAIYGTPGADPDDMRVSQADALAGLCDLAAACGSCQVLAKAQDYLIIECARERKKTDRRQANQKLMFSFMHKWADDLETSGKAKNRAEALIMAAEAYSDLSQRAAGQDTGGF